MWVQLCVTVCMVELWTCVNVDRQEVNVVCVNVPHFVSDTCLCVTRRLVSALHHLRQTNLPRKTAWMASQKSKGVNSFPRIKGHGIP